MTAQIDKTAEIAGNKMLSSGRRNGRDENGKNEVANGITENKIQDEFITKLRNNPNAYPVETIRRMIESNYGNDYNVLQQVFDDTRVEAIKKYETPAPLPTVEYSESQNGYVEVYFWGLRGTGKTCTIGSVIGYLTDNDRVIIDPTSNGQDYIIRLQQLFSLVTEDPNGIVRLPGSTDTRTLPVIPIRIEDSKNKWHYTSIIDVAGENFNGIYKKNSGCCSTRLDNSAVTNLTKCLNGKKNYKIHFFIIEYGEDSKTDGIYNSKIMDQLITYFDGKELFGNRSLGMFVLFTKCDKINILKNANAETKENMRSDAIKEFCKQNKFVGQLIKHIKKIAKERRCTFDEIGFSIGDVFARDLCNADYSDAAKIVNIIESHTTAKGDGWIEKVTDRLNQ